MNPPAGAGRYEGCMTTHTATFAAGCFYGR